LINNNFGFLKIPKLEPISLTPLITGEEHQIIITEPHLVLPETQRAERNLTLNLFPNQHFNEPAEEPHNGQHELQVRLLQVSAFEFDELAQRDVVVLRPEKID
jgi:hypothetical protein